MNVSLILVTRNRMDHLRQTLEALRHIRVPDGLNAELLVVDNGSMDDTAGVVRSSAGGRVALKYIGVRQTSSKTLGMNLGVGESSGDVVLFTDDDVRPPMNWLDGMCEPIARGCAKAVAGGVKLAEDRLRPWMTPMHRSWLASTEWLTPGAPESMVGANMAVARDVFRRVPCFDPELGPGTAGFGDDGLFASQVLSAGYKIHDGMNVCVEHHFEHSRLERGSWLSAARRRGESLAYIGHHWEHWGCRFGRIRLLRAKARLAAWRAENGHLLDAEGCCEAELRLIFQLATVRGHLKEKKRERNYERHGLVKLRGTSAMGEQEHIIKNFS